MWAVLLVAGCGGESVARQQSAEESAVSCAAAAAPASCKVSRYLLECAKGGCTSDDGRTCHDGTTPADCTSSCPPRQASAAQYEGQYAIACDIGVALPVNCSERPLGNPPAGLPVADRFHWGCCYCGAP